MTNNKFPVPTIPLVKRAHTLAQQFAREQATPYQGKRAYLNALAVYAVHTHLNRLNITTDLSQSDSWNSVLRALSQPADLLLPGMGKLECCPVLPGEAQIALPERTDDRLGFVAVQFGDRLDEVQLIGFIAACDVPEAGAIWAITDLKPFNHLLVKLSEPKPETGGALIINLENWFRQSLTAGWQTLETLLDVETIQFAFDFRGLPAAPGDTVAAHEGMVVSACKVIDFTKLLATPLPAAETKSHPTGSDSDGKQTNLRLVLLITLRSNPEAIDIAVRVCPTGGRLYLPADLHLVVWDQAGALMQADSRQVNNWIQLEFSGQPGERFSLKVALGEVSITEEFQI